MEEQQGNIITLVDEDGRDVEFDLLMSFDYEGKRYAALLPVEPLDGVGEDEVVLLEAVKSGDGEDFVSIDNPILLDEVWGEFTELFEDMISENDEETPE